MLATRNGARTLCKDTLADILAQILADICALWLRRERDGRHGIFAVRIFVRVDQAAFTFVPGVEQLLRLTDNVRFRTGHIL